MSSDNASPRACSNDSTSTAVQRLAGRGSSDRAGDFARGADQMWAQAVRIPWPCSAHDIGTETFEFARIVDELRRLQSKRREARLELRGDRRHRLPEIGARVIVGEDRPGAADELQLRHVASGCRHRRTQRGEILGTRSPERVETMSIARQPAQHRRVHLLSAEPHPRPVRPIRPRFDADVVEGEVLAGVRNGAGPPRQLHDLELLVEDLPPLGERHTQCVVLVATPTDRRLNDKPSATQEIESPQLARQHQGVPQGRQDRPGNQPDPICHRCDRRQQQHRVGPGGLGILIARRGVRARVSHHTLR